MDKERRINIRVSPEEFDQMDKKRFEERRTFQEIGLGLFRAWLSGKKQPSPSPDPDPDVAMLLEFKRIASPEDYEALKQNIVVFLRDARRVLAGRKRKEA